MENTMMKSQSAAAVNSANVVVRYNDVRPNGGNYKWQVEKINAINEFFNAEFFSEEGLGEYASVEIIVNGDEVFPVIYVDGKKFSPMSNKYFKSTSHSINGMIAEMENMAKDVAICVGDCENKYYPIAYPYMPWIENYVAEREIKCLWEAFNEAPMLEEDNITEEGYSMRGLEYLAETMPVVPVDAIVEGVNEYFSDCYAVARNRCMGFYECDFEEFCDIVWSYVWPNVMTDEALEAETRYYMEFNDRLRYMLDNGELGALYIYNNDFVRSHFDEEAEVAA